MKLVQKMMEKVLNEIRHSDFDFTTENGNYHYIEVIDNIETEFIFLKHHDEQKVWTYKFLTGNSTVLGKYISSSILIRSVGVLNSFLFKVKPNEVRFDSDSKRTDLYDKLVINVLKKHSKYSTSKEEINGKYYFSIIRN